MIDNYCKSFPCEKPVCDCRRWWTISLPIYGAFQYYGTSLEAEEMRASKAQWEGETATIREATDDEAEKGRTWQQWEADHGYPMDERQRESLGPLITQDTGTE